MAAAGCARAPPVHDTSSCSARGLPASTVRWCCAKAALRRHHSAASHALAVAEAGKAGVRVPRRKNGSTPVAIPCVCVCACGLCALLAYVCTQECNGACTTYISALHAPQPTLAPSRSRLMPTCFCCPGCAITLTSTRSSDHALFSAAAATATDLLAHASGKPMHGRPQACEAGPLPRCCCCSCSCCRRQHASSAKLVRCSSAAVPSGEAAHACSAAHACANSAGGVSGARRRRSTHCSRVGVPVGAGWIANGWRGEGCEYTAMRAPSCGRGNVVHGLPHPRCHPTLPCNNAPCPAHTLMASWHPGSRLRSACMTATCIRREEGQPPLPLVPLVLWPPPGSAMCRI